MTFVTFAILAIIASMAVASSMMTTTAMAKSKHAKDDAFVRGATDAKDSCQHKDGCHWYILGKHKGFEDHSPQFNENYVKGFCAAGGGGSDADQATFGCN